jgi:hypothetical protein
MEVEKWRKTVNQASPAFAISRRSAERKRSSAEGAEVGSTLLIANDSSSVCAAEHDILANFVRSDLGLRGKRRKM